MVETNRARPRDRRKQPGSDSKSPSSWLAAASTCWSELEAHPRAQKLLRCSDRLDVLVNNAGINPGIEEAILLDGSTW